MQKNENNKNNGGEDSSKNIKCLWPEDTGNIFHIRINKVTFRPENHPPCIMGL